MENEIEKILSRIINVIWAITGFAFALLLIQVGFVKTLLIAIVTCAFYMLSDLGIFKRIKENTVEVIKNKIS